MAITLAKRLAAGENETMASSILAHFRELISYIKKQKSLNIPIAKKNNSWNKCLGDITSCLFSNYIEKMIGNKYAISGPNSFVDGFPYEFDLLILKKGAKNMKFTSIYKPEDVVCCVEFKSYAPRKNEDQLGDYAKEFKRRFKSLKKIKFIYLTMLISDKKFDELKSEFEPEIKCFRICKGTENSKCFKNCGRGCSESCKSDWENTWKSLKKELLEAKK